MKLWNDFFKPVVVLTVICLLTSALLGVTNNITKPIIEQNAAAAADATRAELLPEADTFDKVEITAEGVTEMYAAANGAGYVLTASAKGYGGEVPVMVAFDKDGAVKAVNFLPNSETPGLGQKVRTEGFQSQFTGREPKNMTLSDIDAISGATISSGAAVKAINNAIAAYNEVAGEKEQLRSELAEPEAQALVLPDAGALTALDIPGVDEISAYKGEKYGVIITASAPGFYKKPLEAMVGFDDEGKITGVWLNASNETEDVGGQIGNSADFADQFIGKTDAANADAVAGATVSSKAAIQAVSNAIDYYNAYRKGA